MLYLSEIYIADVLALLLLIGIVSSGAWKSSDRYESRLLLYLIVIACISCVLDPLSSYANGRPGGQWFCFVYLSNFWLYATNLLMGPVWVLLINHHMNGRNPKWLSVVVVIPIMLGVVISLLNVFNPIIFMVDSMNMYHRGPLFWLYNAISVIYIILGIILYVIRRLLYGSMRFFPVSQFFIPVLFGLTVQALEYGISVIWPSCSIGMAVMIISLQNEKVYLDQLTGLYNRTFLDKIERDRMRRGRFVMMMLDMNEFKEINDRYGHTEGDHALITVGRILQSVSPSDGLAIRYAGDEFFVIFGAKSSEDGEMIKQKIEEKFEEYNQDGYRSYRLSASIGYGLYDLADTTMDTILKDIDKRMYEQKEIYYKTHERRHE